MPPSEREIEDARQAANLQRLGYPPIGEKKMLDRMEQDLAATGHTCVDQPTQPCAVPECAERSARQAGKTLAFLIETIAHLSDHPTIRANTRNLLIAAKILRNTTDRQLLDAAAELDKEA